MQIATNSRLRAFNRCRRLHYYRYELLRRAIVSARPLAVGSLIHAALEAWWTWFLPREAGGRRFPTPLDAAIAAMGERIGRAEPGDGEVSPYDVAAADALITGYDLRWFEDASTNFEVLAVEAPFAMAIVNPDTGRTSQLYTYGGKLDVRLRRVADGVEGFMEHKSTVSDLKPEATYWRKLRMDSQINDYFLGLKATGSDPRFCIYDVVSKPGLRPKSATPIESRKYVAKTGALYANQRDKDETPEEFRARIVEDIAADPNGYYGRAEIVQLDDDARDRQFDVWATVQTLHQTRKAGRHARNTDACFDFGRPCDYFAVCSRTARIEDDTLFRTAPDAHEELIGTKADELIPVERLVPGSPVFEAALAAVSGWSKDRDDG